MCKHKAWVTSALIGPDHNWVWQHRGCMICSHFQQISLITVRAFGFGFDKYTMLWRRGPTHVETPHLCQVDWIGVGWLTDVPNGKHFVKWYYCGRNPCAITVNFSIKRPARPPVTNGHISRGFDSMASCDSGALPILLRCAGPFCSLQSIKSLRIYLLILRILPQQNTTLLSHFRVCVCAQVWHEHLCYDSLKPVNDKCTIV